MNEMDITDDKGYFHTQMLVFFSIFSNSFFDTKLIAFINYLRYLKYLKI